MTDDQVALLHQALLRQVSRGMAWMGAWGPNMGRKHRMAYLCRQTMEEARLSPKTPYVEYVGQFDEEAWEPATKIQHAYLQMDPIPEGRPRRGRRKT